MKTPNKAHNTAYGSSDAFSTRPFAWRYMRLATILFLLALQFSYTVVNASEHTNEACGLSDDDLYGPVNVAEYFNSIEARCSLEDDEALIMEYSFSEYCVSEKYQAINMCGGESDIRSGGVKDRCNFYLIEKYNEDSIFRFSTKFKRRIYSTRLGAEAHIWFKSKDKGAIKFVGRNHECL